MRVALARFKKSRSRRGDEAEALRKCPLPYFSGCSLRGIALGFGLSGRDSQCAVEVYWQVLPVRGALELKAQLGQYAHRANVGRFDKRQHFRPTEGGKTVVEYGATGFGCIAAPP